MPCFGRTSLTLNSSSRWIVWQKRAVTTLRWRLVGGKPTAKKVSAKDVLEDKSIVFTGGEINDETFHYRLMAPAKVEEGEKYPLVVFLHGAGERGTDNEKQLFYFPEQMAQPRWRNRFPCYVLAPQCRPNARWVEVDWNLPETHQAPEKPDDQMKVVLKILDKTLADEQVDQSRIYLTGLSMGGYGTWDLAMRKPQLFAAVAPICAGADNDGVGILKDVPVWVAHGGADSVVPVNRGRLAVAALKQAGGKPVYVELPGVGHNSWTPSYSDNDGLVPWLFRQKKQ